MDTGVELFNEKRARWEWFRHDGLLTHFRFSKDEPWRVNSLENAWDTPDVPKEEQRVTNAAGGVKADGGKPLPSLLYISLRRTLASVITVVSFGARKYSPDNWERVEQGRYWDAFYRHLTAHHAGEELDPETGEPHLSHALSNLMFISEQRLRLGKR